MREDAEDADALEQLAHKMIPVAWQAMYAPAAVARQSLATLLTTQGPATSKFQIDAKAPGGETLAQKIDAKDFSGMVDAVALCCLRIEEDFPGGPRLPPFEAKWGRPIRGGCLTESVNLVVDREKRLSQLALNERNKEESGEDINPPRRSAKECYQSFS